MTDSYYELIDADPLGEKFCATDLSGVRGPRPFSMPRPCRRCWFGRSNDAPPRDDTRLSRVAVDLLGPVPTDGDMWAARRSSDPANRSS